MKEEVEQAFQQGTPLVALESTVITHGLPYPENLRLAQELEQIIRDEDGVPVTIALLDGRVKVGLTSEQLKRIAQGKGMLKISLRDFASAIVRGLSGGTTVAATMHVAHQAGIKVFVTGGIGGVHRQPPSDISADLTKLGVTPIVVVCAGAKAILDLPATLEYLETLGVPVIGYRTDEFPAFYSRSSGLPVSYRAENPEEVVELASAHWRLGLHGAVLLTVPLPEESALSREFIENVIQKASTEAEGLGIRGQKLTPFLLKRVSELSGGASLKANLALLRNNARIGMAIARQFLVSESREKLS